MYIFVVFKDISRRRNALKYSMSYRLLFKTNHVSLSCISPADDILSNL